ncbi:hypothetical protein [Actinomadura terrae]|uniref:hypothetical protein n=1 Tax=Actinomadura terrae TaxID=604353 RepID=UPI001FA76795|nr:hypothetical protein [Actinomadura terrae]
MLGTRMAALTTTAGAALALTAFAPAALADAAPVAPAKAPAAAPVATGAADTGIAAAKRKSFKCASPRNQKLNISWSPGNISITVYFNNHCKQKRHIKLVFKQATDVCFTVNPRTKGKKKVWTTGGKLEKITSPSKC